LAERFVSGAPAARFAKKKAELEGEFGDFAFEGYEY
jgi:hypothetical protein